MTILNFSGDQNQFFVPALLWALLATAFAVLPIIFWPAVSRAKTRNLVLVLCVAGAIGGLAAAALNIGPGFSAIDQQRREVQTAISTRYGFDISFADVAQLVNGATLTLPATGTTDKVHLEAVQPESTTYALVHTISAAASVQEFPVKG